MCVRPSITKGATATKVEEASKKQSRKWLRILAKNGGRRAVSVKCDNPGDTCSWNCGSLVARPRQLLMDILVKFYEGRKSPFRYALALISAANLLKLRSNGGTQKKGQHIKFIMRLKRTSRPM